MAAYGLTDEKNVLNLLIQAGADVNELDLQGESPLTTLFQNRNLTDDHLMVAAEMLIQAGADINHLNNNCDSSFLLYLKSHSGREDAHTDVVNFLLNKGAFPGYRDDIGNDYSSILDIYYTSSPEQLEFTQSVRRLVKDKQESISPGEMSLKDLLGFTNDTLSEDELFTLIDRAFKGDTLSFSYFGNEESRNLVDFIGSVVKKHLQIEEFIDQAIACNNEEELIYLVNREKARVKALILEQEKEIAQGLPVMIYQRICQASIDSVNFDHSQFEMANSSPVLREFYFYLLIFHWHQVKLDIFQSDTPELTDIFWLFPRVPLTLWGDVEPAIPLSPLSFKRNYEYRIGDFGDWIKNKA